MKISDFIAKTVQAIDAGVKQIDANKDDEGAFYVNDSDPSGQVGITFEIPININEDEPSLFPFESAGDYSDAPIPRVSFTIRRR